jgi:hypothetical protein
MVNALGNIFQHGGTCHLPQVPDFQYSNEETAINVVDVQTEAERNVPFSMEQLLLDMPRLLSKLNRYEKMCNDIDMSIHLTRLWNVFPPQLEPRREDTFHCFQSALFAASAHNTPA